MRSAAARCAQCKYDLREHGHQQLCPECGFPVGESLRIRDRNVLQSRILGGYLATLVLVNCSIVTYLIVILDPSRNGCEAWLASMIPVTAIAVPVTIVVLRFGFGCRWPTVIAGVVCVLLLGLVNHAVYLETCGMAG